MPFKKGITPPGAKPFKKGVSGNPKGKPRKLVRLLKDNGYTLAECSDTVQVMMAMTIEELKEVFENKDSTILEKTIANALKKSLEKGSLYSIDTLMTRVFGKPKETSDVNQSGQMVIKVIYGAKDSIIETP